MSISRIGKPVMLVLVIGIMVLGLGKISEASSEKGPGFDQTNVAVEHSLNVQSDCDDVSADLSAEKGDIVDNAGQDCEEEFESDGIDIVKNDEERLRMQEFLDDYVRPQDVVSTIKAESGEFIDCVDIHSQPALRQPGMNGHAIQFAPENDPFDKRSLKRKGGKDKETDKDLLEATQTYAAQGEMCAEGSVPMRRLTMDVLNNFETLEDFRTKESVMKDGNIELPKKGPTSLHQYAVAYKNVSNWGAESVLNLWRPYTERSDEFTLSQIWVSRGSDSNLETVEAGWQKYRDLYGDWNSRLFIYFTPDNYGSGGCYNLSCGAFVQTNNSVYIGGDFSSYSTHGGPQYTIKLLWYKDGTTGSWWLRYGNTWVGYYPRSLFDSNGLRNYGSGVDFGGEIINRNINNQHTRTDMGSGYMPYYGFGWAAYQRSVRYVDTNNYYRQATGMSTFRDDSDCYDISLHSSSGSWEQYFYFGGWGYNSQCE